MVAQEVRGLAQRSASSAKEIKELIRTSSDHVGSGVALVGAAGGAISSMVSRITEINELMASIASAASEQSQGISQVSIAVSEMDQITQQNAAMVEETSAETQQLTNEAAELLRRLAGFQTGPSTDEDEPARQSRMLRAAARPGRRGTERPSQAVAPRKMAAMGGRNAPAAADGGWEEF